MADNFVPNNLAMRSDGKMFDIKAEEENWRSVFPEEIWLVIAKKADFVAHQRLRDSSPYLWVLLENAWTHWFPEFVEILYKQLKGSQRDVEDVMKKCRLVCSQWQKSVDAVFLKFPHPLQPMWYGVIEYGSHGYKHPFDIVLHTDLERTTTRFRHHFAKTHAGTNRNPFLYRSVFIDTGVLPPEARNQVEGILQFLRDYGQHIWHCVVCIVVVDDNYIIASYRKFYEMLKLMPNLQTLSLGFVFFRAQQTTLNELDRFIKAYPFPTLKHLKSQKVNSIPTSVFNALMRANPQITKLHLYKSSEISFVSENLMQLEDFSTALNDEQHLRMLKDLSFSWPLKQLYLNVAPEIPTCDLYEFLGNNWSSTLRKLTLDFSYTGKTIDVAPLNLPNLQTFFLKSLWFTSLDFLLPTKSSLKSLSVRVQTTNDSYIQQSLQIALEAEGIVKFLNFRNNLSDSNIWSIFPKLQSVDYKTYEFGRPAKPLECRRLDWMLKQAERI